MINKKTVFLGTLLILVSSALSISGDSPGTLRNTALLIIDVQDFYFPGGALPLVGPEKAAANIKKLLLKFRAGNHPVIHIRHNVKNGGEIFNDVLPLKNEKVFTKDHANSFRDTGLLEYLSVKGIRHLVITGMQTHMCVEAAARAGADHGFRCTVISDACATRDLEFNGKTVRACDVHNSTLSTLNRTYAFITDTNTFITGISGNPPKAE